MLRHENTRDIETTEPNYRRVLIMNKSVMTSCAMMDDINPTSDMSSLHMPPHAYLMPFFSLIILHIRPTIINENMNL